MKKLVLALAISMFGASYANAGFMIEPYLGYETGDIEQGSVKGDISGIHYGARIGMTSLGFMFGVDYMMGGYTTDVLGTESDVDNTDLGLFIGYEFPVLIRAYATYFLKSESEDDSGSTNEGTGLRLGIGFTGLPFVAINLEMITRSYDEDETGAISPEIETSTFVLNVSLPLP